MKRIGKRTRMNLAANKRLKQTFSKRGITTCEARLPNCMQNFGLSFCHRAKRRDYRTVEELSDFQEVILTCASCHGVLEYDREKLEEVFERLRS